MNVPTSESTASSGARPIPLRLPQHQYVAVVYLDLQKQLYSMLDWEGLICYADRRATTVIEYALKLAFDNGPILLMSGEYPMEALKVPEKTSVCGAGLSQTILHGEMIFKGYNISDVRFTSEQSWNVSNARLSGCKFKSLTLHNCQNLRISECEIEELTLRNWSGFMNLNTIEKLILEDSRGIISDNIIGEVSKERALLKDNLVSHFYD